MRRNWGKILISLLLLVAVVTTFVGCSTRGEGGGDDPNVEKPVVDPFYTEGYIEGTTTVENIYADLMGGLANTMDVIGKDVTEKSPTASAVSSISADINGKKYDIEFKLNIDERNAEKVQYTIDVFEASKLVLGIYTYRNIQTITTYVTIDGSKFYWENEYNAMDITFPMQFDTEKLEGYATLMSSMVMVDTKSIKYEYRAVGTKMERHYYLSLDMGATLEKLVSVINLMEPEQQAVLEILLKNLMGVGLDDINNGDMPETQFSLEFTTSKGYNNTCGGGVISKIGVGFNIEATENEDTMFKGDAVNGTVDVKSFTVSTDNITNIKQQTLFKDYINIKDALFNFYADVKYDGSDTHYNIQGSLKTDFYASLEDQMYVEVTDKETAEVKTTLAISNNVLKYCTFVEDEWVEVETAFDFVAFFDKVRAVLDANQAIPYSSLNDIICVLASLSISEEGEVVYSFMKGYFDVVFNIDNKELMQIMTTANPSIIDDFAEQGISLEELMQFGFDVSVDNTKTYLTATKIDNNI